MSMTQQETPLPGVVEESYSAAAQQASTMKHHEPVADLDDLMHGGPRVISPYYGTGGNWTLRPEAFVKRDLQDFAIWTRERFPHADAAVYTRKQIINELEAYAAFMATDAWPDWLPQGGPPAADYVAWLELWRNLPPTQRAEYHKKVLDAKKIHLESHLKDGTIDHHELARRCSGLFIIPENETPRAMANLDLPPERHVLTPSRHVRGSSLQNLIAWMTRNLFWTFLLTSVALGMIVVFLVKLVPLIRE